MGQFITGQAARERLRELCDQVDAAYGEMGELCSDAVGNEFRVDVAERLETQERLNRGLMYRFFGEIADPPDEAGLVAMLTDRLGARLRLSSNEIKRRMKLGRRLRPQRQISGPPTPPEFAVVADAVAAGTLGEDHLKVICGAMDRLPSCVSPQDRAEVEASLVREAAKHDADFVKVVGKKIDEIFNPDGHYDEAGSGTPPRGAPGSPRPRRDVADLGLGRPRNPHLHRSRHRRGTPGPAPTRRHPAETPDDRSPAQRCHDGLKLGLKAGIASSGFGAHRGHPVTVIVRTTLAELNQAAHAVHNPDIPMPGPARTGGDTALPMRDLIRMATDAIHYLAVFENHSDRPLYLGRQQRLATTDQRIICYSRDGGCTRPNCVAPGYHSEVHHSPPWTPNGATDADALHFACGPDHALVTDGHLHTTVTDTGRLAWTDGTTPPAINHAHHPEELLRGDPDPPMND